MDLVKKYILEAEAKKKLITESINKKVRLRDLEVGDKFKLTEDLIGTTLAPEFKDKWFKLSEYRNKVFKVEGINGHHSAFKTQFGILWAHSITNKRNFKDGIVELVN